MSKKYYIDNTLGTLKCIQKLSSYPKQYLRGNFLAQPHSTHNFLRRSIVLSACTFMNFSFAS